LIFSCTRTCGDSVLLGDGQESSTAAAMQLLPQSAS
jgi:hypothetical protein